MIHDAITRTGKESGLHSFEQVLYNHVNVCIESVLA